MPDTGDECSADDAGGPVTHDQVLSDAYRSVRFAWIVVAAMVVVGIFLLVTNINDDDDEVPSDDTIVEGAPLRE